MSKTYFCVLLLLVVAPPALSECVIDDHTFNDGEHWLQNKNFNVTCRRGKISVLNCVTDNGTFFPVGTASFIENGIKYSCHNDDDLTDSEDYNPDNNIEGSGEEEIVGECSNGNTDYVYHGFSISCLNNHIIGCIDPAGNIVVNTFFYLKNKALKYCKVFSNGRRGRIENKGCFNGTIHDNPSDDVFHVPKYTIWTIHNGMQYRCGDDGIKVYKCPLPDDKTIHTGSAWIDNENVLNVCG